MSSAVTRQNSGSESDPQNGVDERKRKRMLSNRESARRSRMRKQQRLDEMIHEVDQLRLHNSQVAMQIGTITEKFENLDLENTVLRTRLMELTERLQSVNSVLRFVEEFSGMAMDIPEIPDPLMKPWQIACPSQPIMASAGMFQH